MSCSGVHTPLQTIIARGGLVTDFLRSPGLRASAPCLSGGDASLLASHAPSAAFPLRTTPANPSSLTTKGPNLSLPKSASISASNLHLRQLPWGPAAGWRDVERDERNGRHVHTHSWYRTADGEPAIAKGAHRREEKDTRNRATNARLRKGKGRGAEGDGGGWCFRSKRSRCPSLTGSWGA